jgi:hypothetical protein
VPIVKPISSVTLDAVTTTTVTSSPTTTISINTTTTTTTTTTTPYTFNLPIVVNDTSLNIELTVKINDQMVKSENNNADNNGVNSSVIEQEQGSSAALSIGTAKDTNPSHSFKKIKLEGKSYTVQQSSLEYRDQIKISNSDKNPIFNRSQTPTFRTYSAKKFCFIKSYNRATTPNKIQLASQMPDSGQRSLLNLPAIKAPISDTDLSCSDSNASSIETLETSDNGFTSVTNAETSVVSSTITCVETPVSRSAIMYSIAPTLHRNNKHLLALLNSDTRSNNGTNSAVVKKEEH